MHIHVLIIWNKTKLIKQSNNDLNEENLNGVQNFRFHMHCQINTLNYFYRSFCSKKIKIKQQGFIFYYQRSSMQKLFISSVLLLSINKVNATL